MRTDPASQLKEIVDSLPRSAGESARSFHNAVERALISLGWSVVREYPICPPKEGPVGFIDLVVTHPYRIAIELDRQRPRARSMRKLGMFDGLRFVVLRDPHPVVVEVRK